MIMTVREEWDMAAAAVAEEYGRLSVSRRAAVAGAAEAVKSCKKALHRVVEAVAAADICASCRGACCRTGKYHFTVVDLLVYLSDGRELFTPGFDKGGCPYLGERGCLMEPPLRPYNCVTFNCEEVERLLDPRERERLVRLELELRAHYRGLEELFGNRFMGGLLMNWERSCSRERAAILGGR